MLSHAYRTFWVVCCLLVLGACGSVPTKELVEPEVFVRDFEITNMTLSGMEGIISLDVKNPNDVRLSARSLDYEFYIAGRRMLDGATDENFSVPALGQDTIQLPVRISYQALLDTIPLIIQNKSADYKIQGNLGTTFVKVPFDKQGRIALPDFTSF